MKRIGLIACAALLFFALAGCGAAAQGGAADTGVLKVVATIFPPYDFARSIIGGEAVELTMLLPPGVESHGFEPTPQDIRTLSQCDVLLMMGGESEAWAQKVLEGVDTASMQIVRLIDCAGEALLEEEHTHEEGHNHEEHGQDDAHEHALYDEHIWTSPVLAGRMANSIYEAMAAAAPTHADAFAANLAALQTELSALDAQLREIVDSGARREIVFADRFPFRYFTEEYGIAYRSAYPGCNVEAEPSAATVAELMRIVREDALPAVFYLELSSEKMADALIEGTSAKKLLFHSCHTVTKRELEAGETYLSLMRANAENLRIALS